MRIALMNKVFSPRSGGAERYAWELAHALIDSGHAVHLYGWTIDDPPAQAAVHRIDNPRLTGGASIRRFNEQALAAATPHSFDVVYSLTQSTAGDFYFAGGGLHAHWLAVRYPNTLLRRIAVAFNPAHRAQLQLENAICSDPAIGIIVNSRRVAGHFRAAHPSTADRLHLVRHAVDHRRFNPETIAAFRAKARGDLGLGNQQLLIVFPSHNWRRKGLATLIRSIAGRAELKHCVIAAVGRGRPASFRRLARRLRVADRVKFLPPTELIESLYAAGDIVALPTLDDPCAVACLEAMACGLPVVTSAANGAGELIQHTQSGHILQRADDAVALAESLVKWTDADQRRQVGNLAWQAMQPWTWHRHVTDLLAAFGKRSGA